MERVYERLGEKLDVVVIRCSDNWGKGGLYLLEKFPGDFRVSRLRGGVVQEAGATGAAGWSAVESVRTVWW